MSKLYVELLLTLNANYMDGCDRWCLLSSLFSGGQVAKWEVFGALIKRCWFESHLHNVAFKRFWNTAGVYYDQKCGIYFEFVIFLHNSSLLSSYRTWFKIKPKIFRNVKNISPPPPTSPIPYHLSSNPIQHSNKNKTQIKLLLVPRCKSSTFLTWCWLSRRNKNCHPPFHDPPAPSFKSQLRYFLSHCEVFRLVWVWDCRLSN